MKRCPELNQRSPGLEQQFYYGSHEEELCFFSCPFGAPWSAHCYLSVRTFFLVFNVLNALPGNSFYRFYANSKDLSRFDHLNCFKFVKQWLSCDILPSPWLSVLGCVDLVRSGRPINLSRCLQSVSWSLAEFRHNKIVQSPHENYFNICRQHKEK